MSELQAVPKDKLIADLRAVVADAEELLRATAGQASNGASDLRAKIQANLQTAKANLAEAQAAVTERAKAAGKAADEYVHENPWTSIGVAAGVGLLVGMLISRK